MVVRFAPDSPLEEARFELPVPGDERVGPFAEATRRGLETAAHLTGDRGFESHTPANESGLPREHSCEKNGAETLAGTGEVCGWQTRNREILPSRLRNETGERPAELACATTQYRTKGFEQRRKKCCQSAGEPGGASLAAVAVLF